jgi:hypothetical protein
MGYLSEYCLIGNRHCVRSQTAVCPIRRNAPVRRKECVSLALVPGALQAYQGSKAPIKPVSRSQFSAFFNQHACAAHWAFSALKHPQRGQQCSGCPYSSTGPMGCSYLYVTVSQHHEAGWRSIPCGGPEIRERCRCQTNEYLLVTLCQADQMYPFSVGNRHPATHRRTHPQNHVFASNVV